MIFTAEPRELYLEAPDGSSRLVIGWTSRRERLVPMVADTGTALVTVVDDPETLGLCRYRLFGPTKPKTSRPNPSLL